MSDLLVEKQGAATIFTINRPDSMNAMSRSVMTDLAAGVKEFNADPSQKVAILTAAGEKAFCAGADLKEMAASAESGSSLPVNPQPDIVGIAASEKPWIAAVNGLAVAGGMELTLCCDIRLAAPEAYFGLFEVKRGILAGLAVTTLPRLLPYGVVADMLLAGERISADRAYQLGLVQDVVPRDQLVEAALKRAEMIGTHSPSAVWGSKQVIKYYRDLQLAEAQKYYEAVVHRVLLSGDVMEGPKAFAEKRQPTFSDGWPKVPGF